jgi:hypothetical protein
MKIWTTATIAGLALCSSLAASTVEVYTGNFERPVRLWTGTAVVGTNQFAHLCYGSEAASQATRMSAGETSVQPRFWLKALSALAGLNPEESVRLQTRVWEVAGEPTHDSVGVGKPGLKLNGRDFAARGCETASSQGFEVKIVQPAPALVVGLSWLLTLVQRRGWSFLM